MLREQARNTLQAQLDAAVTNGDTDAARKATAELEKLAIATAPKALPFGDAEIRAELDKQPWFGTDPKKSAKAVEFGKTLDPKKFATAAAFAEALVKAVEEEFKPAAPAKTEDENEDLDGETEDENEDPNGKDKTTQRKRSDAPGDGDAGNRSGVRRTTSGPWTKLSDAPAETQKEIKRQADRFVSSTAPKEQREKFIAKALESHYAQYQRNKGKK